MSNCVVWQGRLDSAGYGRVYQNGKDTPAHRAAWEDANGRSVPPGMVVMHTCDNPPCVSPEHLKIGTHGDNQRDKAAKGRQARGEAHGRAKLSKREVREIRRLCTKVRTTYAGIARQFGVSAATVRAIHIGKIWKEPGLGPAWKYPRPEWRAVLAERAEARKRSQQR